MPPERQARTMFPAFTMNGHDTEVCCVSWSRTGRYIASMDDEHFRIWSADNIAANEVKRTSNCETIKPYELCESEKTTLLVHRYIASMDDEHFRIWSADNVAANEATRTSNVETIKPYELCESEKTTLLVHRMTIGRDRISSATSPLTFVTPSRKRKEPFASPIKRLKTPTKSPNSKIMK
ncbi:unnamed protein product [Cylicostephanus goldi]|uniref:Uncharacterized protein n=1 Tax=Cylicostephanus goldi TaxID=71465 RepID=A0A3P7R6V1_CYLGO|nr:unnamed protein product [Cylicostephanus goldi]